MNTWEKYLRDNKEELDQVELAPEIWLNIENQVLKEKAATSRRLLRWVSLAACLGILLSFGLIFQFSSGKDPLHQLANSGIDSEQYLKEMAIKTRKLSNARIPMDHKADFELLIQQLRALDEQYESYLDELEEHGYQELLANRIISYYKTKIELLDRIQEEIETVEYYEKKYDKNSLKVELSI
ncbi:MAG: hypothetical protein AAFR87_20975 [Bacteroidota bacterium]